MPQKQSLPVFMHENIKHISLHLNLNPTPSISANYHLMFSKKKNKKGKEKYLIMSRWFSLEDTDYL